MVEDIEFDRTPEATLQGPFYTIPWGPSGRTMFITGHYRFHRLLNEEDRIIRELVVGLNHETHHQVIYDAAGHEASEDYHNVYLEIEGYLGWPEIEWS